MSNGILERIILISAMAIEYCQAKTWHIPLRNIKRTLYYAATFEKTVLCFDNMVLIVYCWGASVIIVVARHCLAVKSSLKVHCWRNLMQVIVTSLLTCWTSAITKARGIPISYVAVGWSTFCCSINDEWLVLWNIRFSRYSSNFACLFIRVFKFMSEVIFLPKIRI